MNIFEAPILLSDLIEGGYKPQKGDKVYDVEYFRIHASREANVCLTGANSAEFPEQIGYDSVFNRVQFTNPRSFAKKCKVILLSDLIPRLEEAYRAQYDDDFSPIEKLLSELNKLAE